MQAYRTLSSRWAPFAVRWAFPTAIDYYEALRPHITSSGTATPVLTWTGYAGSLVPQICLYPNLGSIYTPEALSRRFYLCTVKPPNPCFALSAFLYF